MNKFYLNGVIFTQCQPPPHFNVVQFQVNFSMNFSDATGIMISCNFVNYFLIVSNFSFHGVPAKIEEN